MRVLWEQSFFNRYTVDSEDWDLDLRIGIPVGLLIRSRLCLDLFFDTSFQMINYRWHRKLVMKENNLNQVLHA